MCVCVCPVLLHALKIALPCYAVLYFSYFTLLSAVVLVVRWRRCLVAGATRPQGSVLREEEERRALLVVEEAKECKWILQQCLPSGEK